jgi:hypothetical protein
MVFRLEHQARAMSSILRGPGISLHAARVQEAIDRRDAGAYNLLDFGGRNRDPLWCRKVAPGATSGILVRVGTEPEFQ